MLFWRGGKEGGEKVVDFGGAFFVGHTGALNSPRSADSQPSKSSGKSDFFQGFYVKFVAFCWAAAHGIVTNGLKTPNLTNRRLDTDHSS